ncbi:MAG: translation initiation factor IF-2 [candidate division KSB1 bacterium]|nr:translation initiation factor IF-2 [candidate division KSB1 bacterium]
MVGKRRLFQVAREFNISNEELIEFLQKQNFKVKNQMSPVTDEMYEAVVRRYQQQAAGPDEEVEFRRLLREKRELEEARRREARRALEEKLRAARELVTERERRVATVASGAGPTVVEVPPEREAPGVPRPERRERRIRVIDIPTEEKAAEERPVPAAETVTPEPEEEMAPPIPEAVPEEMEALALVEEAPAPAPEVEEPVIEEELTEVAEEFEEAVEVAPKKRRKKRPKKHKAKEEIVGSLSEVIERAKEKKEEKRKKKRRPEFTEEEIERSIRQTLAAMQETGRRRKYRKVREKEEEVVEEESNLIRTPEFITTAELASLMGVTAAEVIQKALGMGLMVSMNQRLDAETITLLADEFGYDVEIISDYAEEEVQAEEEEDPSKLRPRAPVVTVMGHVDHGKTSLLDYIRKSNVVAGEKGGITQHIGAYEVELGDSRSITFLDTPGHEAFTAMRARGAQVTDIVVLVVAADDHVMPQTVEAINHAKAAGVPIIVAINKMDKPNANPDLIKRELADHNVLVEEWGGRHQCVEISAKTGMNVDKLLEAILLEAEMLDLKANPDRPAKGTILESRLDRGRGVVATVLVQNGTLRIGDPFVAGMYAGRVRAMFDERDRPVKEAGPSRPVLVVGFDGMPQAGDPFTVVASEREAKEIATRRQQLRREQQFRRVQRVSLDEISRRIRTGEAEIRELPLIVKADVDGSLEAISDSLMKLATGEVAVRIVHKGVGAISESDVLLAAATGAIIIGFHVRATPQAREAAKREEVDIRIYDVIYDLTKEVKDALEGLLEPETKEEVMGVAEVRQTFRVPKVGTVAGCYVLEGRLNRNDRVKVYRDDKLIFDGRIASLKRFKDDVREVSAGLECGVGLDGFDDIKIGDVIEAYQVVEIKRTLD